MAWSATAVASANSSTDTTAYATGSYTPTANRLMVAFVFSVVGAGTPPDPTLSGNSLTWDLIESTSLGTGQEMWMFGALSGTSPTASTLTATFSSTQTSCIISVSEIDGADITGTTANAFVQSRGSNGSSSTFLSFNLTDPPATNSRCIAGFFHFLVAEATTPRLNWTELHDLTTATGATSAQTQWSSNAPEITASAEWATSSGIFSRAIAAEMRAFPSTANAGWLTA